MKFIVTLLFFSVHLMLLGQDAIHEFALYPDGIPNSKKNHVEEKITMRSNGTRFISHTVIPTLTVYQPEHPNGMAIVICPGGGYGGTSIDKEGYWVADSLVVDSITSFVLKYRLPDDATQIDKSIAPLQDAQQAIRTVRNHAKEYHIDPSQIGIMGFSAGGHLAATAATQFERIVQEGISDTISVRPDFAILMYPVISFSDALAHMGSRNNLLGSTPSESEILKYSAEKQVTDQTPPVFLVHAEDDTTVPVGNSIVFYQACIDHGVQAEMHLYAAGGHGFGMFNLTTPDVWMDRLRNWLRTL